MLFRRIRPVAAFALLLNCAIPLLAQTPAGPRSSTDAVELWPFEVSSSAVRGYVASETMTCSRVKTPIVDLPYSVNVMTSEFLEDFGIFDLLANVTHISGFTGLDIGGNFNHRGFSSSNQLRDGFFRLGRYGSSNIDRMEIIKGSLLNDRLSYTLSGYYIDRKYFKAGSSAATRLRGEDRAVFFTYTINHRGTKF